MINKIGNWVFGSFFRTIGRLLVFVLLGFIIANLVDFSDIISNFRITDLFFEKVNAEEIGIYHIGWDVEYYSDNTLNSRLPSNDWFDYHTSPVHTSPNATLVYNVFYIKPLFDTIDLTPYKGGYITIPFHMTLPTYFKRNNNTIYGSEYCSNLNCTGYDTSLQYCYKFTCNQSGGSADSTLTNYEYVPPQINLSIKLEYANGYIDICRYNADTSTIMCPITAAVDSTWSLKSIQVSSNVYYDGTQLGNYTLNMMRKINFYSSAFVDIINSQSATTNAIDNQTQQQQQQHEEMMDSNTTQAQEDAEGFFGDFSVPDTGGLSGIITAPLNTIRSLLNSTCTNLVLPLPFVNKDLTLPCLYDIYNEHFGAFFTIYQTIVLAIVAYRCIRSIYFDIHGFMDPNDDRIEVMDL